MKLMIASDIHGSAYWCRKLIDAWKNEGMPRMLLLGDLLYHGPRNDLPKDYAPKQIIEMLNGIKEHLLCVRGNCEAEVDQMVLNFPVLADYCIVPLEDRTIYATHGHNYGENNPPPMMDGDILLCGHTHIPTYNVHEHFCYVNPGSVSIPKNGSAHGYLMLDGDILAWKDLDTGITWKESHLR